MNKLLKAIIFILCMTFTANLMAVASEEDIEQVLNTKIVIDEEIYNIKVPTRSFEGRELVRDENGKK